jgi:predicted NAD/FAD-binding protein
MTKKTIAVIGSGIAGLSAAWLLSQKHDVTLFEQDDRLGGHSNTFTVSEGDLTFGVDTGFIVYNERAYPNLVALFKYLDVDTDATNMGFAVSLDGGSYEYSGNGLSGLFGQTANLFRPAHWQMLRDLVRFFHEAQASVSAGGPGSMTLGEFLAKGRYSTWFQERHILPMAAAIWSTPAAAVMDFPAASFFQFFANHQLLQLVNRPLWRTVHGGSREYVMRLLADYNGRIMNGAGVTRIQRFADRVEIHAADKVSRFDACVVATHADQALALLGDADQDEVAALGKISYAPNRAVLHTDPSFMPKRRSLWSSWNYTAPSGGNRSDLCVTYWMNCLQKLEGRKDYFVSLNPPRMPDGVITAIDYAHPMFDKAAMGAKPALWKLQGRRRTWFCGSYFGYGFHEDGIQSGLAVAEMLGGVRRPWTVENESGRIGLVHADERPAADNADALRSRRAPEKQSASHV